MAKHTAAPWLIAGEDKTFVYALGPMETNKFWAHVQYAGPEKIDKEEAAANALLISAAPELLEALQAALLVIQDYLNYDHDGDPWSEDARLMGEMEINDYKQDGRLDAALAVISKATGQCLKGEE